MQLRRYESKRTNQIGCYRINHDKSNNTPNKKPRIDLNTLPEQTNKETMKREKHKNSNKPNTYAGCYRKSSEDETTAHRKNSAPHRRPSRRDMRSVNQETADECEPMQSAWQPDAAARIQKPKTHNQMNKIVQKQQELMPSQLQTEEPSFAECTLIRQTHRAASTRQSWKVAHQTSLT
ncbi:hypothetical protein Dimus_004811 [Dionaea muscipula]